MNSRKNPSTTKGQAKKSAASGSRQISNSSPKTGGSKAQRRSKPYNGAAYNTSYAPVAITREIQSREPRFNGQARVVVSHRELIGAVIDIAASGFHQINRLRVNPGSAKTFNWLSTIAPNYEFYRFRRIHFDFETRVSTAHAGSLIMSPDYDAAEGDYALTEQSLFNNLGTSDDSVWKSRRINLKPELMNRLYKAHVNMSDPRFEASKQDEKTIDSAQLFIALDTEGKAGEVIGKLIVDYDVEFWGPQSPTEVINAGGANLQSSNPTVGSNVPITQKININKEEAKPILIVPEGLTYPTGTVGQFTQDWEGIVSQILEGTNVQGPIRPYINSVLSDMNLPTGTANDIISALPNGGVQIIEALGSRSYGPAVVKAKKGDLLRVQTSVGTALTALKLVMGGGTNQLYSFL